MANVMDVAKYILSKAGPMTTFKLQKLCYYSQVWSLVWDDERLIDEEFYAWANGPVAKTLYGHHKGLFKVSCDDLTACPGNPECLSEVQIDTIDSVLSSYGHLSGQQLSVITHTERPWLEAREGLDVGERGNQPIDVDTITEFYSALHLQQQSEET